MTDTGTTPRKCPHGVPNGGRLQSAADPTVLLQAAHGDTLEWDVATEGERDRMRAIAAELEPTLRVFADRLAAWIDDVRKQDA